MDSLYDNLENYEDVNIIQDLKNENTELKQKLERYSSTLNQLQIDFDKLTSEYKKLEMNYSSLLKTARAEIEKKTKMITQLNVEKDMFVIQAFKKNGKRLFSGVRHNMNIKPDSSEVKCERSSRKDEIAPVKNMSHRDSLEKEQRKSFVTKENMGSRHTKSSQKIMNRRKSMPVVSHYESKTFEFNSEGEKEQCHPSKDKFIREQSSERRFYKTWVDDKYSNYNVSKDCSTRSSRYSSYHNENKHRSRDKSRHRQHRSPERTVCSNFKENYYQHCRSRSPPSDRYIQYKSRDRHSNYNDYTSRDERHVVKHKLQPHSEEPCNKKIKIDSYGQYLNPEKDLDEQFVSANQNLISPEDPYRSSQSPDRINPEEDNNDQFVVKEIVQTATIPLEDPRLKSKNYILQNENGKAVLKKCTGDICMKFVDKSIWKIPNVTVPDALLQKPPSPSKNENLAKEINVNLIDDLNFDTSLESFENHIGSSKLHVTKLSKNEKEKCEGNLKSKCLDHGKKSLENTVYKIPKKNKITNDTLVEYEGCSNEKDLGNSKTIKSINQQDLQPLDLPNIVQDTQPLVLEMIQKIINTPNFKGHEYQVLDKVSLSTVEGDLLLSDDASDVMDFQKQNSSESSEKNTSPKMKTEEIKANKDVLCEKKSHCEVKSVKYSGENIKNKDTIDNTQKQSNNKKSKKDNQALHKNLCEKKEARCDESRTFENVPVDVAPSEVKDKYNVDKGSNTDSAAKTSYQRNEGSEGGILCTKSVELGKSKFMDLEGPDSSTNQNTKKNSQGAEVSVEEARCTYETMAHPSSNTGTILNTLIEDISNAQMDKETIDDGNRQIIENKDETSKTFEKKLLNLSNESEIINDRKTEIPNKKEKISRRSKAKNDIPSDEILPEGKDKPSIEIRSDSSKSRIKEMSNTRIGTENPVVDIKSKETDMHKNEIKECLIVKSSDLSHTRMESLNREQDIEKSVENKIENETTYKKNRTKKKTPDTKLNAKSKDKNPKKNTSKKGKEARAPNVKTKFSDLFGDSNSLIMPEDLGIRSNETTLKPSEKFVSIFDDTQSAVDLSVGNVKPIENDSDKMLGKTDVSKCLKNVSNIDQSLDNLIVGEHVLGNDNIIRIHENISDKGNLYENLNPATSMDGSNVIIISRGIQSNCAGDEMTKEVKNVENIATKSNPIPILKALATSTPLKIDVEPIQCIDKHIQTNDKSQETSGTDVQTNSAITLNAPDAPDIRIFVKRRRKIIKKP